MNYSARFEVRFPIFWLILACAAVIGSWVVIQWPLVARTFQLSAPVAVLSHPLPHITEERAISIALNDFEISSGEINLQHPSHRATFTDQGVSFTPRGGGPEWAWQLSQVRLGAEVLSEVDLAGVPPTMTPEGLVQFVRGPLIEQYVAQVDHLEQQFVLPERLPRADGDLVIVGEVTSAGRLETTENGWRWADANGEVNLGNVFVFDAAGTALPATMRVTSTQTEIRISGTALSQAAYPVTIDPEIGANDFRISDMGGDTTYDALRPAVAYNSDLDQYLVVWEGDDYTGSLVDDEFEIFGQRVDGASGTAIGDPIRLSDMGPDGDPDYDAAFPDVAYNPTQGEYLVVWHGDDNTGSLVDNELEIYGQLVEADTGAEIGGDLRLSDMGLDGSSVYDASRPAVAYHPHFDWYMVIWQGDDNTNPLVEGETEIFAQSVDGATGTEIGSNDRRLSYMGPDGDPAYDASNPALALSPLFNDFLVVWGGDDDTGTLVDNEFEIFGQIAGPTGVTGSNFRLSDMGPDGDPAYDASNPAVAYNPTQDDFLVVWQGDDNTSPLVDDEFEIFGQRVDWFGGTEIGGDFRLSDMGPDGDPDYDARSPAVTYNPTQNEYLVVWYGDDNTGPLVQGEDEIYGQRLAGVDGAEIGGDFRLSDMGPDGDLMYDAINPAVAYNSTQGEYLAVWKGDDSTSPLMDEEFEIFGQRVAGASGTEIGGDIRLSEMGLAEDLVYDASDPAVAYNPIQQEYLVVWYGDDNTGSLVDEEFEIYGQRVDAVTGAEIGGDIRLSDMGPDGDQSYNAYWPAVTYNATQDEYLVVWNGDDNTSPLVEGENEIFGQRVAGASGAEIGDDFRLSDMGPDGDVAYDANKPAVAYNPIQDEYLVIWVGDDNTGSVDNEFEVFGQRLAGASGAEIGGDFQLSDMGPAFNQDYDVFSADIAYNPTQDEYLVVWQGDDNTGSLVDGEDEIFGQRVDGATGADIGGDIRLSDMGSDGNISYFASRPAVAYNPTQDEYLVVWEGEDDNSPQVNNRYEIFGQRVDGASGTEVGTNDFRLSDMGPAGAFGYEAVLAAVAYSSTQDEYLVVWSGDDGTSSSENEYEIYGQRYSSDFKLFLPLIQRE